MADTFESLRTPPHSIEAEQSVLGGLMMSNKSWLMISDKVSEIDFYRQDHRLIFRALKHLAENNQPMDVITLSDFLKGHDKLEEAGGLSYLGTMAKDTPSAANIEAYAEIVHNKASLRNIMEVAQGIFDAALKNAGGTDDVRALVEESTAKMFELELRQASSEDSLVPLKPVLRQRLENIQTLSAQVPENGKRPMLGLATGFDDFDRRISGLQPAKVITVGARPGLGKTTFGTNVVEHLSINHPELLSLVFSCEMQREELADKFMSSSGRVEFSHIRDPWDITEDDWPKLSKGIKALAGANIYIDDAGGYTVSTIRSRARRLMRDTGLPCGVILIDYLQLLRGEKRSYANRNEEIGEISRAIKQLAKDLNTPIILLSQLSRAVTKRTNPTPVLSDLRESGDIEQDSDVVVFIHRDMSDGPDADKDTAELITAKCRAGQTGTDRVAWLGKYQRFDNLQYGYDSYQEAV